MLSHGQVQMLRLEYPQSLHLLKTSGSTDGTTAEICLHVRAWMTFGWRQLQRNGSAFFAASALIDALAAAIASSTLFRHHLHLEHSASGARAMCVHVRTPCTTHTIAPNRAGSGEGQTVGAAIGNLTVGGLARTGYHDRLVLGVGGWLVGGHTPARHTCLRIDGTRVARIDVSARNRGGAKGHHIPLGKTLDSYPLAPTPRARDNGAFLGVVLGPELGEPDVTVPRGICADPLVIHLTREVLAAHGRALAGSAHPLITYCGKEDGGI